MVTSLKFSESARMRCDVCQFGVPHGRPCCCAPDTTHATRGVTSYRGHHDILRGTHDEMTAKSPIRSTALSTSQSVAPLIVMHLYRVLDKVVLASHHAYPTTVHSHPVALGAQG